MYACTPSKKGNVNIHLAAVEIGREFKERRTSVDLAWVHSHAEDGNASVVQAPLEVFHEEELHRLRHRCVAKSVITGGDTRETGGRHHIAGAGEHRVLEVSVEVVDVPEAHIGRARVVPS